MPRPGGGLSGNSCARHGACRNAGLPVNHARKERAGGCGSRLCATQRQTIARKSGLVAVGNRDQTIAPIARLSCAYRERSDQRRAAGLLRSGGQTAFGTNCVRTLAEKNTGRRARDEKRKKNAGLSQAYVPLFSSGSDTGLPRYPVHIRHGTCQRRANGLLRSGLKLGSGRAACKP